MEHFHRAIENP